jgi:hypothetical protein
MTKVTEAAGGFAVFWTTLSKSLSTSIRSMSDRRPLPAIASGLLNNPGRRTFYVSGIVLSNL